MGLLAAFALGLGLAAAPLYAGSAEDGHQDANGIRHGVPRIASGIQPLATSAHLTYYGGRVISNVQVIAVNWGPSVDSTISSQIGAFYSSITNSAYFDWLTEYNTVGLNGQDGQPGSNQTIGRGTYGGQYTISPSTGTSNVTDSQIQSELAAQLNAGHLPAPATDAAGNVNTIYMIDFPPGMVITDGSGSQSCVQFCAYHGTMTYGGKSVPYGVLPDLGGSCASGCGSAATKFQNQTSVASHELIEAVTDMEVGIGSTVGRPLAWYDSTNGEIGDICNAQQGTINGYTVQKEWSNVNNACIVTGTTTTNNFSMTLSPSSASVAAGSTVSYTVSTTVTSGSAESLSLSVSGLPAGVTGSFSPSPLTAGNNSTLTLTASSSAAAATATFTVTATGASASHTASASVSVTTSGGGGGGGTVPTNGNFETGSLSPWTATGVSSIISSGAHSGTYAAQLGSTSPSTDSTLAQTFTLPSNASTLSFYVKITCPDTLTYDWVTASMKDNSTGTTSTLLAKTCSNTGAWQNVSTSVSANAGHSVTLTLANHDDNYTGDATYSAWDDVTVSTSTATPSFSLSASPTSVTAAQGASATSTLTTTVAGGFNSSISFSASGVPSGATASFSPTSIAAPGSGSSTLTLAAGTAAAGTYTVTVTATGGGITHTAAITFSVTSSGGGGGAQQLIGNPGFENGSSNPAPWTTTSGVVDNSTSEPAHSGSWKAWLDGYGTTHTDTIVQTVAIPSNITTATLSFWLHIDTAETTTTSAYDTLQVQVRNSSGTVLATLATYSNLNAASGYTQKSFNVLAYKGQTIQVYLVGSEDSSNQTSFVVDDFALNVQ